MNYIDELAMDIYRRTSGDDNPAPVEMQLYRTYALLALTTGEATTNEHVHDAWSVWVATHRPEHRSLRPFAHLTPEVQELDTPYRDAIRAVAREL